MSSAEKPNIILILTDDMGFSDLGCFGGKIATPHLDALAAGGMRFTGFYNTALCWPTRATLMSGRYEERLRPEHTSITEVLKPKGYQTGMAGKWHLSENPIDRGFDSSEIINLTSQFPERVKELSTLWEARFAEEEKQRAREKAERRERNKQKKKNS